MLRRSLPRRIDVRHTCAPSFLQHPSDLAFYFPRFHPRTHIQTAGIPELQDAVALMTAHSAKAPSSPTPPPSSSASSTSSAAPPPPPQPPRWSTTVSHAPHELTDAVISTAQRDNAKSLLLLERGVDILNSVGGASSASVANLIRPLFAARFELMNSSEHTPRSDYSTHQHVQKAILHQAAALLYHNDVWDKSDVQQLDTSCVILGHFVKAFCALHQRPFHQAQTPKKPTPATSQSGSSTSSPLSLKSKGKSTTAAAAGDNDTKNSSSSHPALFDPATWQVQVVGGGGEGDAAGGGSVTLPMVMERIDELLLLSQAAVEKHGSTHPTLRWLPPKLLLLKALVTIPLTGHLLHAQQHIRAAATIVDGFTRKKSFILEGLSGRTQEPELGLFVLLQAEVAARIVDWDVSVGQVDENVWQLYEDALEFYPSAFNTAIESDGIMAEAHLPERRFEAEAYACCLRSFARFLLGAPRPKATSTRDVPVFLPKQVFSLNPLLSVATSSPYIYSDVQNTLPLPLEQCRRRTGECLDRALKLNRLLYPEARQNPAAASTLLAMACMYADTRDYLYATGLFESSKKSVVHCYGESSVENVLVQKLRYEFLAGVGSDQEAKTASHEVVHLLKRVDSLPF